jgi:hypothetical protein
VVGAEGRAGGVHPGGLPAQQRVHLAVVLILFALLAAPLRAQSDIDFDPAITQEEFTKFSRLVAQGIFASPVQPAGASGLLRFDVGIAATLVEIDTGAAYWQRAVGDDFSYGSYIGVPRLVVMKGLGIVTLSGSLAKVQESDIEVWGGAIDLDLISGGVVSPTLALRGTYSQLRGIEVYDLKTYGVELFLGKGFGPITPYAAIGRMRSSATGRVEREGETLLTLTDQSDINRYTVGARLSLGVPKLVIEANQAEERSYSAKVSLGF